MVIITIEQDPSGTIEEKKEEFICATLSLIVSAAVLAGICHLLFFVYRPNIDEIVEPAVAGSIMLRPLFLPEPVERMQYMVSVLLSPFIVFLSYRGICRLFRKNAAIVEKTDILYRIVVAVTLIGVISLSYFVSARDNFFYLEETPLYDNFFFYMICLFPIILICTILAVKNETCNTFFALISGIIASGLTGVIFFMTVFNKNEYYGWLGNFDAVFYSVTQVYAGKSLLVGGFKDQYGLYPHFLEPVFHLTGLTVLHYSVVMSSLVAITFILLFFFLKKTVSNNVLVLLGFTSVVFFGWLRIYLVTLDPFFQYLPVRTIFPALFIFLSAVYLKGENKIIYYCLGILSSVAVLWNLDTGAIVFLTWLLLLWYSESFQPDKNRILKNCLAHLVILISILLAVFLTYSIFIWTRSGSFPDFSLLTQYQQFFYLSGFLMLPMPLFHPWNIIIITYFAGLLYAFSNRTDPYIAKIIFLLTVLGFGLFSYYQGRSHDYTLAPVAYPAILLWTIFADISFTGMKKYGLRLGHNLVFGVFLLCILSVSIFGIGYHLDQFYHYSERGFSALDDTKPTIISKNIAFIKNSTGSGEKILILGGYLNGVYYAESHTESALNTPGLSETMLVSDYNKIPEFLIKNTDTKIFVDTRHMADYSNPSRISDIYDQIYRIDSGSPSNQMVLLRRDFNSSKVNCLDYNRSRANC